MRDQDNTDQNVTTHSVSRILMISPNDMETVRRNRSRIFIFPMNEGMIDSLIFQTSRPIEDFQDVVFDAIQSAGLRVNGDDDRLIAMHRSDYAGGMLTSFFETNGWLVGEGDQVFDLVIEVAIFNEQITQPKIRTFNGQPLEGGDRPLCLAIDISEFQRSSPTSFLQAPLREEASQANDNANQPQRTAARQQQEGESGSREGSDNSGSDNDGRQAGKPGRVRDPLLDGRLKHNRRKAQEGEGNSPRAAGGGSK